MESVSSEQINNYVRRSGKKATRVLSALGKNKPFMTAMESDIGQELLTDATERMEAILDKIISEEATPQELADFRALKAVVMRWSDKINSYLANIRELTK